MPFFRRAPRQDHDHDDVDDEQRESAPAGHAGQAGRSGHANGLEPPTTAELRARRALEWERAFLGASREDDYRRAFLRYSPLFWDIVQSTQCELLRLLVGRAPAEIGVPAIFGLTVLFGHHGKPDDAARATLAMIVNELEPAHARTLLISLADAWHNAERRAYDERGRVVADEFSRSLRRLRTTAAEEGGAISAIEAQVALGWENETTGGSNRPR